MNYLSYIANKLQQGKSGSFSALASRIAVVTIMLAVATLIISFSILEGFKEKIREKIFSFGAHIQVSKYEVDDSFEDSPITYDSSFVEALSQHPEIGHVQIYLHKPGLLKSTGEISGVIMKGVGTDFDTLSFKPNLKQGRFIAFKQEGYAAEVVLSARLSSKLNVALNDSIWMYFIQDPPRFRKLKVVGIYETGLEEFDEHFVIADIGLNQKMNEWSEDMIGGYEISLKDFNKLDALYPEVYKMTDADLYAMRITDKYLEIFDWLQVLNQNVFLFIVIVLFVASFNTISTVFVLIVERTSTIGLLKALGARNRQVRKIFFIQARNLLGKGLLFGNLLGLGLTALQYYFQVIPLDPVNYYMYTVPVSWNWPMIIAVNILITGLVSIVILIPLVSISFMKPVRAIKFN